MRRSRTLRPAAVVACGLAIVSTACSGLHVTTALSGDPRAEVSPTTIFNFLERDPEQRFTTLLDCINVAGASSAITGTGPVTLFAPTNAAFAKTDIECDPDAETAPEDAAELLRDLQLHVVDYDVRFTPAPGYDPKSPPRLLELIESGSRTIDSVLTDAPGTALVVNGTNKTVYAQADPSNVAKIVEPDVQAPNGMVQVIDSVLTAPAKAEFPPTTVRPQPYE